MRESESLAHRHVRKMLIEKKISLSHRSHRKKEIFSLDPPLPSQPSL